MTTPLLLEQQQQQRDQDTASKSSDSVVPGSLSRVLADLAGPSGHQAGPRHAPVLPPCRAAGACVGGAPPPRTGISRRQYAARLGVDEALLQEEGVGGPPIPSQQGRLGPNCIGTPDLASPLEGTARSLGTPGCKPADAAWESTEFNAPNVGKGSPEGPCVGLGAGSPEGMPSLQGTSEQGEVLEAFEQQSDIPLAPPASTSVLASSHPGMSHPGSSDLIFPSSGSSHTEVFPPGSCAKRTRHLGSPFVGSASTRLAEAEALSPQLSFVNPPRTDPPLDSCHVYTTASQPPLPVEQPAQSALLLQSALHSMTSSFSQYGVLRAMPAQALTQPLSLGGKEEERQLDTSKRARDLCSVSAAQGVSSSGHQFLPDDLLHAASFLNMEGQHLGTNVTADTDTDLGKEVVALNLGTLVGENGIQSLHEDFRVRPAAGGDMGSTLPHWPTPRSLIGRARLGGTETVEEASSTETITRTSALKRILFPLQPGSRRGMALKGRLRYVLAPKPLKALSLDPSMLPPMPSDPIFKAKAREQVLALAEAHATHQTDQVQALTTELSQVASPDGCSTQKLVFHFLRAFASRFRGRGDSSLMAPNFTTTPVITEESMDSFLMAAGWVPFSEIATTYSVIHALRGHPKIHVIFFNEAGSLCWQAFFQELADQPGGAPLVRVTSVNFYFTGPDDEDAAYEPSPWGLNLHTAAREAGVPLAYRCIRATSMEFQPHMVSVDSDEAVAVVSCWSMMVCPDSSVLKSNPRNAMLKWIHSLAPKIFVLLEVDANFNSPFFLARVKELLQRGCAVFEVLDAISPRGAKCRPALEFLYMQNVSDCIACEGLNRFMRSERMEQWLDRLVSVGFSPVHFPPETWDAFQAMSSADWSRQVKQDGHVARLQWWGVPALFGSAWVPLT